MTILSFVPATAHAGLTVGGTRVVFFGNKKEVPLTVTNSQNSSVYLIRSWIESPDKAASAPFIITPPLFRIDPGQENALRIAQTSNTLPQDKESLYWVNVLAIPPASEKKNTLQFSVNTRLKLIYRPAALMDKSVSENAYKQLTFARSGTTLTAKNPTPYYINLFSLSVGGTKIKEQLTIPPRGEVSISAAPTGNVLSWAAINDFGGITPVENKSL
ncbi:molecular chaperone (plasmid) [Hafnia alvei]|nr:molecular chaperone [Hafnia alvei]PNL03962.1 fimbrial assembly protein [Hafnia alvei]